MRVKLLIRDLPDEGAARNSPAGGKLGREENCASKGAPSTGQCPAKVGMIYNQILQCTEHTIPLCINHRHQ